MHNLVWAIIIGALIVFACVVNWGFDKGRKG